MHRFTIMKLTPAGICCVALTLLLGAARCSGAEKRYLAQNGKTAYTIVCEDHEPVVEVTQQRASGELKLHLEQMTGATFPVVSESSFDGSTPALYVGKTKYALKHGLNFDAMALEFWTYQTVRDAVIFTNSECMPVQTPPLHRQDLIEEYRMLSKEQITAYCSPAKQQEALELLEGELGKPVL